MPNNAANVTTGKPKIGGAVYRAPAGTAAPTNATTALNLTAENYGFCFVNETAVHNAPNRGELLFFDLDSPDLVHPLSVVYKKKRHLLPAARAFVDAARRFLQSQSWRSECDCRVEHGRPV